MIEYRLYTLSDPLDRRVRYVGVTSLPLRHRLNNPLKKARNRKKRRYRYHWIYKALDAGRRPEIRLLMDGLTEDSWEFWEQHFIMLYHSLGYKRVNGTSGGDGGFVHTERSKRLLSLRAKEGMTEERRRKISMSQLKPWSELSPVAKKRIWRHALRENQEFDESRAIEPVLV